MQGKRPLDLCSGGILWSCCVPNDIPNASVSTAEEVHEPGIACIKVHNINIYILYKNKCKHI
jgi:hypothetical protein